MNTTRLGRGVFASRRGSPTKHERGQAATEVSLVLGFLVIALVAGAHVFVPSFVSGTEELGARVQLMLGNGIVGRGAADARDLVNSSEHSPEWQHDRHRREENDSASQERQLGGGLPVDDVPVQMPLAGPGALRS